MLKKLTNSIEQEDKRLSQNSLTKEQYKSVLIYDFRIRLHSAASGFPYVNMFRMDVRLNKYVWSALDLEFCYLFLIYFWKEAKKVLGKKKRLALINDLAIIIFDSSEPPFPRDKNMKREQIDKEQSDNFDINYEIFRSLFKKTKDIKLFLSKADNSKIDVVYVFVQRIHKLVKKDIAISKKEIRKQIAEALIEEMPKLLIKDFLNKAKGFKS